MKFEIDGDVLKRCELEEGETTAVVPEGVKAIGKWAFRFCSRLKSVVIPEGVTEIGGSAFWGCSSLKSVVIPEGVTEIGGMAFDGCSSLESVVIPEGVTVIGKWAFSDCSSLDSVQIMNPRTEIEERAFEGCRNLDRMILSDGGSVLIHCPAAIAVGDVVIPESVRRIGAGAFRECKNLSEITLPENVSTVSERAFEGCVNLKKVHIASPSTQIELGAFVGCTGLEHMILTDNETVLVYCPPAFANGCIRLPETITCIERHVFENCTQLTAVEFPKGLRKIGDNAFKGCAKLTSVNFPDGLLEIGQSAFDSCPLKSVTLSPSVKKAPEKAFPGCREITIYDSIDADCGDCNENFKSNRIDPSSGCAWNYKSYYVDQPCSKIGFMPIHDVPDPLNCTIIVRSAATGDIKYIVEVENDSGNWDYRNLFFFGWGKNATFAFRELDKIFPKIKGATHKQRVALLRLQYGVDLDEEMHDYYQKYVSRSIKDILRMCIREERMDWIKVCEEAGVLRKATVEYAIEQATAEKKPVFTAFFLEYQNKHFPLKAGKDNTGLRLPDLPRAKKKKTADKTSGESI